MDKLIAKSNWLTGLMIFFMPVLLIFFLGSQMAYSQVNSKFKAYQNIPEITRLAALESVPAGQVVMLRGQIAGVKRPQQTEGEAADLLIFQERPAAGREVRFQEEFRLVFPEFGLALADGAVTILPSLTREHVIQYELRTVQAGERERTGFGPGDTVTVQGQWQPAAGTRPALVEVTGISGANRHRLLLEWQQALAQVSLVRNGLGILSLLGLVLLLVQLRRSRGHNQSDEEAAWPGQETKTIPTA